MRHGARSASHRQLGQCGVYRHPSAHDERRLVIGRPRTASRALEEALINDVDDRAHDDAKTRRATLGDINELGVLNSNRNLVERTRCSTADTKSALKSLRALALVATLHVAQANCAITPVNGHVDIPESWTGIGQLSGVGLHPTPSQAPFYRCSTLSSVSIPNTIEYLGKVRSSRPTPHSSREPVV